MRRHTALIFALTLTAACAATFGRAFARPEGIGSWTGRIPETVENENTSEAEQILTESGLHVRMGAPNGEVTVNLGVVGGSFDVMIPDGEEWVGADVDVRSGVLTIRSSLSSQNTNPSDDTATRADSAETAELTGDGSDTAEIETTEVTKETETIELVQEPKNAPTRPDSVTVTVKNTTDDGKVLWADFLICADTDGTAQGSITLDGALTYYNPKVPIPVRSSGEACTLLLNGGMFPSGTRYRSDNGEYLLMCDDYLHIPANTDVLIDLSGTQISGDIDIGGHSLTYYAIPNLSSERAYIIGNTELVLPMRYTWGGISPTVKPERLKVSPTGTATYEPADGVKITPDSDGREIRLTADGGSAGTYRVTLTWSLADGTELYRMEIPFYIMYDSVIPDVE